MPAVKTSAPPSPATTQQRGQATLALLKSGFSLAINPGALLKSQIQQYPWPWTLAISGLAYLLFFLQTGMDLHRAGRAQPLKVLWIALVGIILGTVGIAVISGVAWLLTRPFGRSQPYGWALRAFALAYCPALVYGILGLGANLFWGWNTTLAFGVTGFLWAFGPIIAIISELAEQRLFVSYLIATLCGAPMLIGWGVFAA